MTQSIDAAALGGDPNNYEIPRTEPLSASPRLPLDISNDAHTCASNVASGVKRSHDEVGNNDTGEDDDDNDNSASSRRRLPKMPKPPTRQQTSRMSDNDTESEESSPDAGQHELECTEWPLQDILYQTRVVEDGSENSRIFYSGKPYDGWADPLKGGDKTSASSLEIYRDVVGSWHEDVKQKPRSMKKDQWKDESLHIDLEKHFIIKRQKHPAMRINSPVVRYVMRYLIKYDPGQILTGDVFVVHWPWHILMHYHDEIEELRNKIQSGHSIDLKIPETEGVFETSEIVRQINVMLKYIHDVYEGMVKPELENHATSRLADFSNLWLLFRPGEEVFARVHGELAAFIVLAYRSHSAADSKTTQAPVKQFIVHVWNFRFVGGRLVRHMSQIAIDEYEDSRLIETLPVFPCKFAGQDQEDSRKRLVDRGKKYFDIIKQRHAYMDHNGLTRDLEPRNYNGRVIIDPLSYVKYRPPPDLARDLTWDWLKLRPRREENSVHFEPLKPRDIVRPEDNGGGLLWKKYNDLDPTCATTQESDFFEDRHFLLFPRIITGFSLRDKQWESYDVESLSAINWNVLDAKTSFPGLILDKGKQDMIKANCRTAISRRQSPDIPAEQIGGKGEGTVFLLHGPPGVGKTFTVECIANYTQQPLLSLGGCDISSTEQAEAKVQHWFDLSKAWDALLLIDEADIFLTWRQSDNLKRNFLVSIFLRTIESFPGTLFLTTNRIGQLDLAINSRVDIAIHFDELDSTRREQLWRQYFAEINKTKGVFIKPTAIENFFADEDVKRSELSGREIRNAFKQAIKIARLDNLNQAQSSPETFKLKVSHLKQAIENCRAKTLHILQSNQVNTEAELAANRHEREIQNTSTDQVAP